MRRVKSVALFPIGLRVETLLPHGADRHIIADDGALLAQQGRNSAW